MTPPKIKPEKPLKPLKLSKNLREPLKKSEKIYAKTF
jgi:hypothetical protein